MSEAQRGTAVLAPEVEGLSHSERPVRFKVGDDEIFGILTEPLHAPRKVGVVLLNATSDRNRFLPRFARRMAAAGFHVVRFDYHGFGESAGPLTGSALKHSMITLTTLEEPFTNDLLGAVGELQRRGVDDVVVIGRCFGSRTALSGVKQIRNLRAIGLISLPMHDGGEAQHPTSRHALEEVRSAAQRGIRLRALRGLLSPRRRKRWMQKLRLAAQQLLRRQTPGEDVEGAAEWVSKTVIDSMQELATRRVPVMIMFGRAESVYRDFQLAKAGPLGPILAEAGNRVTVTLVDGPTNNLTNLAVQEAVMSGAMQWLEAALKP